MHHEVVHVGTSVGCLLAYTSPQGTLRLRSSSTAMRPCVYVTWQQASRDRVSQPRFLTDGQGQEGGGGGGGTTMMTAKSSDQGFSIEKNRNSIHTQIATADMAATYNLLQLVFFLFFYFDII